MNIRQIKDDDVASITEIYNWYISNTTITFEIDTITPLEMKNRVQQKVGQYDWLVGELDQVIIGYAYYGAFHPRPAYRHTVESTIYLAKDHTGQGFGQALYRDLMRSAKERGYQEIIGLIALPNPGSTALHQKLEFKEVGLLKKVGYKFGQYIDVGLWQKSILQR